jgi:TRAP-type transport system periplasmic protein
MRHPSLRARSSRDALRYIACLLACIGAAIATPSLHADDKSAKVPEIRLSTALAPTYPLGAAGERWAKLINDQAAGAFEVRQYPGATLAQRDPGREFGALRDGLADLAVGSALAWSAQFPPLGVYALPWISPEPREQVALAGDAALRERLFALLDAAGVVGLALVPLGERVLATAKAPVETISAARGLRVRVMASRPMLDVFLALGALPQSMSFTLAQAALVAGTLDGQDAMPTTLVATRAYASGQKFVTRWGAVADVMVFGVRRAAWNAWPEERRVLVRAAAQKAALEANALAQEDAALAQLTKAGVTIVRLSPAQRAALRDAAQPAIDSWTAAVGADLVSAARATVAASK